MESTVLCRWTWLSEFWFAITHTRLSQTRVLTFPCTSTTVLLSQKFSPAPELQVSKHMIPACDRCYVPEKQDNADNQQQGLGCALCTGNQSCLLLHFSNWAVLAVMVSLKPDKALTHPVGLYKVCFRLRTFTFLSHALDYSQACWVCVQLQNSAWKLKEPKLCMFLVKGLAGHDL